MVWNWFIYLRKNCWRLIFIPCIILHVYVFSSSQFPYYMKTQSDILFISLSCSLLFCWHAHLWHKTRFSRYFSLDLYATTCMSCFFSPFKRTKRGTHFLCGVRIRLMLLHSIQNHYNKFLLFVIIIITIINVWKTNV